MGTLCKNCPFKGVKRSEGSCTELFAKKFHNSCVTYDISKHVFLEELKEFEQQKKAEETPTFEEEQKELEEELQRSNELIVETPPQKPSNKKKAKKASTVKKVKVEAN